MCFNILLTIFHELYNFILKTTAHIDALLYILQMKKHILD